MSAQQFSSAVGRIHAAHDRLMREFKEWEAERQAFTRKIELFDAQSNGWIAGFICGAIGNLIGLFLKAVLA